MPIKYTDSYYTFTSPVRTYKGKRCGVRRYIKYLEQIAKCNSNGFNPTRRQVQIALGDPDPTIPAQWVIEHPKEAAKFNYSKRCNWGISRWTAMKQAGLIRSTRDPHGNAVRYQLTAEGALLLHSVL